MELTALQKKILETIIRFDALELPLSLLELANFLDMRAQPQEILEAMSLPPLDKLIKNESGLYFLSGKESLIGLRQSRYRLSIKKMRLARLAAYWLSFFPWIRGIAIYSSLALKNSKDQSDIDLFFVTEAGRAWSARFFINVFLKILNLRPSDGKTKNKLCPSYFADCNNLDLSVANRDNDYYYYYLGAASFVFLYAGPGIKQAFMQSNDWIRKILPNRRAPEFYCQERKSSRIQKTIERCCSLLPEKLLKKWQLRILPLKYLRACDGKRVILEPGLIKLHDNDKRTHFNELFANKIKELTNA